MCYEKNQSICAVDSLWFKRLSDQRSKCLAINRIFTYYTERLSLKQFYIELFVYLAQGRQLWLVEALQGFGQGSFPDLKSFQTVVKKVAKVNLESDALLHVPDRPLIYSKV